MAVSFLDFEQPIAELEAKIEELGHVTSDTEVNIEEEMTKLRAKSRALTRSIFSRFMGLRGVFLVVWYDDLWQPGDDKGRREAGPSFLVVRGIE